MAAAVARVLDAGVDVTLHTSTGRLRGMLTSAQPKNVYLILAQVDAWRTPERRLAFARALVASKLLGQRQLLQRRGLDRDSARCAEAVRQIDALQRRLGDVADLNALRGIEGAAAAAYFGAFREIVGAAWKFPGRVRRPPTDPVNALLSFGYTLATAELARHLVRAGFDTRIGLFHGLRYGRESLPLDLVDEVRAPMVDRFTTNLLHRRQLGADDFEQGDDSSVRLSNDARRCYLELWEEMLSTRAAQLRGATEPSDGDESTTLVGRDDKEPESGVTWRRHMQRQVARLYQFLMRGTPYRGLLAASDPTPKT